MKRNKTRQTKKADAILTADIHLSDATPVSRTDDYQEAQRKKLAFLCELQVKHDCPVLDAGDIFNHWKASPWLLSQAYQWLPKPMITIPGNHDLPEHSMRQYEKSGLAFLENIEGRLDVLHTNGKEGASLLRSSGHPLQVFGLPYGCYTREQIPSTESWPKSSRNILIIHEMVWPGTKPPWPGAEGYPAKQILKDNPEFDLILCGHNHMAFTEEYKGRLLVNPGSMMRISADKADYKPRCYLYYADTNTVDPVYYPIEPNVHDTSHLDQVKDRDKRLSAYIERMNMEWEAGLSFQGNLEAFFQKNKTPAKVKELIYSTMEK